MMTHEELVKKALERKGVKAALTECNQSLIYYVPD